MKYKIIATVELSASDESNLSSLINTIKSFSTTNSGTAKLLIRTDESEVVNG